MSLKKIVEQSVYAYEQKHSLIENEMWVMN